MPEAVGVVEAAAVVDAAVAAVVVVGVVVVAAVAMEVPLHIRRLASTLALHERRPLVAVGLASAQVVGGLNSWPPWARSICKMNIAAAGDDGIHLHGVIGTGGRAQLVEVGGEVVATATLEWTSRGSGGLSGLLEPHVARLSHCQAAAALN